MVKRNLNPVLLRRTVAVGASKHRHKVALSFEFRKNVSRIRTYRECRIQ